MSSFSGRLVAIIVLGICAAGNRQAVADTNLVNKDSWLIVGTDDTGPNPVGITMSVNGRAAGVFTELVLSYDVGGSGVVAVCTVKGNGEVLLSVPPPGQFGGSFFSTGYWDCDAGYIPTMSFTQLDLRLRGRRYAVLRGKITNGTSMEAKNFEMRLSSPQSDLMSVDVAYNLFATRDFCVDTTTHTNQDNFELARVASNFVSADVQENDQVRYTKVISKTCFFYGCITDRKSYCNDLVNQDGFIIDGPPHLGDSLLSLVHTQPVPQDTPTLEVRFRKPNHGRIKPQGTVVASADPTSQNVNVWGNWMDAKGQYRNGRRVTGVHYTLMVVPPRTYSCNVEQ